jgi:hypothetical protein
MQVSILQVSGNIIGTSQSVLSLHLRVFTISRIHWRSSVVMFHIHRPNRKRDNDWIRRARREKSRQGL